MGLVLCAGLSHIHPVWARGKGTSQDATESLEAADAAMQAKDYVAARHALGEAYRKSRAAALLYRMAEAERLRGRTIEANDLYRRYLAESPSDAPEQLEAAKKNLAAEMRPAAEWKIAGERGAFVLLDGEIVGVLPLPLPLYIAPGKHKLAVEQGKRHQEDQLDAIAGRVVEVRFPRDADLVVVTLEPALIARTSFTAVPTDVQQQVREALDSGAKQQGLLIQREAAALVQAPDLSSCLSMSDCQTQLAKKNLVSFVLTLSVTPVQNTPNTYALSFDLFDASRGDYASRTQRSCNGCSAAKVATLTSETVSALLAQAKSRPTKKDAPTSLPVAAQQQPGQATDQPINAPVRPPRPKWRLALGGVMIGVGIGMAALGGYGISQDSQCATAVDAGQVCQFLYNTVGVGGFALGSGIVIAGSGVLLMAWPEAPR